MYISSAENIKSIELQNFLISNLASQGFRPEIFLKLIEDTDENTGLRILARFNETVIETEALVKNAIQEKDRKTIWSVCHKIGSTAQLLGFVTLAKVSKKIGAEIKEGDFEGVDLSQQLKHLLSALEEIQYRIKKCCPSIKNYLY